MRKKDLSNLNNELFAKINALQRDLNSLNEQFDAVNNENSELKKQLLELKEQKEDETVPEILKKEISEDMGYAAKIIGEIVVDATIKCNKLTIGGDVSKRELVNLILGRSEVAKAEILKAITQEISFEEKKLIIDNEKKACEDYFFSVLAQND